jgi:hypothetical protein
MYWILNWEISNQTESYRIVTEYYVKPVSRFQWYIRINSHLNSKILEERKYYEYFVSQDPPMLWDFLHLFIESISNNHLAVIPVVVTIVSGLGSFWTDPDPTFCKNRFGILPEAINIVHI